MRSVDSPIGLKEEIESAVCCVENSYRAQMECGRDYMRRMALQYTHAQAVESLVSLWIERAQREARNHV
jgi:hypothetical protein